MAQQDECSDTLKLLSFNVGLLRIRMAGLVTLFSNPPYANER